MVWNTGTEKGRRKLRSEEESGEAREGRSEREGRTE